MPEQPLRDNPPPAEAKLLPEAKPPLECYATETVRALTAKLRDPVNALGRIYKLLDRLSGATVEAHRLMLIETCSRITCICQWALLSDPEYVIDASDREALGLSEKSPS